MYDLTNTWVLRLVYTKCQLCLSDLLTSKFIQCHNDGHFWRGQDGLQTHSAHQNHCHHLHNVKIWSDFDVTWKQVPVTLLPLPDLQLTGTCIFQVRLSRLRTTIYWERILRSLRKENTSVMRSRMISSRTDKLSCTPSSWTRYVLMSVDGV